MTSTLVRAIYKDGHLELLDPISLADNQQVMVHVMISNEAPTTERQPDLHPNSIWTSDDFDDHYKYPAPNLD
jgi:hypothetical protein